MIFRVKITNKIMMGAFLSIEDLVWLFSHTQFLFRYCWFLFFFAWFSCILRKLLQFEAESWPALRRRFELQAFRMVAKIRGFFDPCSIIYLGKFLLEFMKIKNINRHSLKIQISSPTVFTMRMRKFNFGAQPNNGCCLHRAKMHANTRVQYI